MRIVVVVSLCEVSYNLCLILRHYFMFHRWIFVIFYGENVLSVFQNVFSFKGLRPPNPLIC